MEEPCLLSKTSVTGTTLQHEEFVIPSPLVDPEQNFVYHANSLTFPGSILSCQSLLQHEQFVIPVLHSSARAPRGILVIM